MTSTVTERENNHRYWFLYSIADVLFITILIIILAQASSFLTGTDVAFHIKIGDYIIDHRSVPTHDIFTKAEAPAPWTPPAWLSEVILALVAKPFGLTGVVVFIAIIIAASYTLLFKFMRSAGVSMLLAALMTIFAAGVSTIHWLPRPHILALPLLLLWYFVLETYQHKQKDYLYLLPPLMVLWVNIHGSFALGFLLLGIYAGGNIAIARFQPDKRQVAWQHVRKLALILVISLFAAALLNPQGFKILLSPFQSLSNSALIDLSQEWRSPDFHDGLLYELMLLVMIVIFGVSAMRLNIIDIAVVVLFTHMSLYSGRFILLYAVVVAPIIARQCQRLLEDSRGHPVAAEVLSASERMSIVDARTKGNLWSLLAIAVVVVLCITGHVSYAFDHSKMPADAVEFIKHEKIPGRMFNRDLYGGYIIYETWPQYDVFIDGRYVWGEEHLRDYAKVIFVQRGWEEVLDKYGITWIIFSNESALSNLLIESENWHLIYSDAVANIFVKGIPANQHLTQKYAGVTRASTDE